MSGTLLSICTDAMEGVQDVAVPTSIVGNTSPTAKLLKSCAQDIGRFLERKYTWQALKKEYTFATSDGVTAYDIPEELRRFANMTIWSDTDQWSLKLTGDRGWRTLQSGIVAPSIRFFYSVFANQININPDPGATAYNIVFDYYTKYFCESSGGTGQDRWAADTDVCRLDDNLMVLGVRYKYLERNGLPFDEDKASFLEACTDLLADDRPREIIDVSAITQTTVPANISDGSWNL
jgi:hypothetical protein